MTDLEREFDAWVNGPPIKVSHPISFDEEQLYVDLQEAIDAEHEALYYEGLQGEPSTMEEFDEDTRFLDQYHYEQWLATLPCPI